MEPDFLELLACPRCATRPALELRSDLLVCTECGCGYRVVNGIPHLLPEDAIESESLKELLRDQ
ncbi:MAG: Trm112 family protein [Chthonomonas sp.]|nr:Trm112 family protein [Chthonomonas sp.]